MFEITTCGKSEEVAKDGVTIAEISICYPQITCRSSRAEKRINAFYEHQAKSLLRAAKKTADTVAYAEYLAALETSAVYRPFEITASYTVTFCGENTLSLYRDTIIRTGYKTRAQTRFGDTWNLTTGWFLTARGFFARGTNWRRILTNSAVQSAGAQLRAGTFGFYANYAKLIKRKFSQDNFYLTGEGIAIFYAPGDLAPQMDGVPVFITRLHD